MAGRCERQEIFRETVLVVHSPFVVHYLQCNTREIGQIGVVQLCPCMQVGRGISLSLVDARFYSADENCLYRSTIRFEVYMWCHRLLRAAQLRDRLWY